MFILLEFRYLVVDSGAGAYAVFDTTSFRNFYAGIAEKNELRLLLVVKSIYM
jgi:hypothetical protein